MPVDLPHTSAHGLARIVAISACPALAAGEGNLVIGKFETRNAKELVKVTMEDDSVITGTRIHPVWSIDRSAWVELGNLEVGETLSGTEGPTKVQCLTFLVANQPVYNLEVFGEHVYRVGTSGVLCHNTGDGVCTIVLNPGAQKGTLDAIENWRLGGKLYNPAKMDSLGANLNRRGFKLRLDGDDVLPPNVAAGFDGVKEELIFRRNATESEVYLTEICHGLEELHARDFLHRDVKPSNIMRLRDGTIKLID